MQNYVLGVKKQYKEALDVISWHVYVEKASVIYAVNLGSLIIKITSNAIFIKKVLKSK